MSRKTHFQIEFGLMVCLSAPTGFKFSLLFFNYKMVLFKSSWTAFGGGAGVKGVVHTKAEVRGANVIKAAREEA